MAPFPRERPLHLSQLGTCWEGVSEAVASAQPITGDWTKWGLPRLREAPARTTITESLSPSLSTLVSWLCLSAGQAGRSGITGFTPSLSLPGTRGHRISVPRHHQGPGKTAGLPHFCCLLLALLPDPEERGTRYVKTNLSQLDEPEPGIKQPGTKRAQPHAWSSSEAKT